MLWIDTDRIATNTSIIDMWAGYEHHDETIGTTIPTLFTRTVVEDLREQARPRDHLVDAGCLFIDPVTMTLLECPQIETRAKTGLARMLMDYQCTTGLQPADLVDRSSDGQPGGDDYGCVACTWTTDGHVIYARAAFVDVPSVTRGQAVDRFIDESISQATAGYGESDYSHGEPASCHFEALPADQIRGTLRTRVVDADAPTYSECPLTPGLESR